MALGQPERRRAPRVVRTIPVQIGHGADDLAAESIDLSASGVYCRVARRVPVMTKVRVVLVLPGGSQGPQPVRIACTGVVVRVESATPPGDNGPAYRLAIFFTDLTTTDRDCLAAFVDECRATL